MSTKDVRADGVVEQDAATANTEEGAATRTSTATAQHATPLPRKQMAALTVVLLTESVCGMMLLPFVPRFIAHLKHIAVEDAGYYTGILVGLFMLGQVVSSKLWGYLSDTYGRKLPLATGLLASGLAMFFFGYTKSFLLCCLLRFLHGFFNGNVLVAKTAIADVTDRTNEARGFALVSITWGVGSLFGPFIGGFLYNPSAKGYLQWLAGGSLRPFFEDYPAFLPSFTVFLYTLVALACCVFLLKESNVHRKHLSNTALGRWVKAKLGRSDTTTDATDVVVVAGEAGVSEAETPLGAHASSQTGAKSSSGGVAKAAVQHKITYAQAMRIAALRNITIFYMLLSAADMTYGEILPLWGNASHDVGGMGLTENSVAMLMLSYSVPSIIANMYFHHVCHFFNNEFIVFWRYSLVMYTISTLIIPAGSQMGSGGYYYVMFLGMARQVSVSWCYSLIHMLTAKAAPLGCVGAVYGISQSCAAATRCIVPFVVAPLFAWSLRKGHIFPFNYYLVFLVAATPAAVSVVISLYVQITRTEECELDFAVEDTMEAGVADVGEHDDAYRPDTSSLRRQGASVDGDAAESDGGASAYMSLVNSFCTNPLHDTYVNMPELEKVNLEAVQEMHRHTADPAQPRRHDAHAAEDRRYTMARDEDMLPDSRDA